VTRPNKEVLSELFKQHGQLEESEQLGRKRWTGERTRVMDSGLSATWRGVPATTESSIRSDDCMNPFI